MKIYIEFITRCQFRVYLENGNADQAHLTFCRSNNIAMNYARPIALLLNVPINNLYSKTEINPKTN